jgi:hypothetical protein
VAVVGAIVIVSVWLLTKNSSSNSSSSTTTAVTPTTVTPTTVTPTTAAPQFAAQQAAADAVAVAAGCPKSPSTKVNNQSYAAAPPMTIDAAKTYTAAVKTTAGDFTITLDPKAAPQTVNSFVFLASKGYYHCIIFHRVIPGFMDQTGDPTGTGTGGPGYTIPDENPPKATPQYAIGAVAMANTGAPNTGGSQFFIVTGAQGQNLPNTYALFGQVTSGIDVVQKINQDGSTAGVPPNVTQRILSVDVTAS